jgi:hypothetical protein
VSDYVAQIETLEDQAKLEIDQELLETVIPVRLIVVKINY